MGRGGEFEKKKKKHGTDTKVILDASYGGDEERVATLLEYRI